MGLRQLQSDFNKVLRAVSLREYPNMRDRETALEALERLYQSANLGEEKLIEDAAEADRKQAIKESIRINGRLRDN
jgi:hypothetical protein